MRSDADVHGHVIQQLAAVRLTLRGVEGALHGGPLASRLRDSIAELDDATAQLRAAPRRRRAVTPTGDGGLAGRLLEVVMEASPPLDSAPDLHFSGMDVALPDDVEADLRAVLRQALGDVGRRTTVVEVRVAATADLLTAQITGYDGTAHGPSTGGASSVERWQQRGTRTTWTVPLGSVDAAPGVPPTAVIPAPRGSAHGDVPRA